MLLWLLVFGYIVAMAVYSFTFGRYAADALDAPTWVARILTVAVVVGFLVLNMRGVRVSSLTEDVVVVTKLVILATIAIVGMAHFSSVRLDPLTNEGFGGLFLGAATVFFAYEGFELISYDRDDMHDPDRTLPRSLYLSVAIVAAVYIGVTLGAQMLVSDHAIVARKEVAFIAVGEAALGSAGRWAAIIGAIFATGSAINATLFSCARLIRDASVTGELPAALGRETDGLPFVAMLFISVAGIGLAMLPGITAVIAFGSGAFLAIYTVANYLQMRMATGRGARALAAVGALTCLAAIGALLVELGRDDPTGLGILLGLTAALTAARFVFVRHRAQAAAAHLVGAAARAGDHVLHALDLRARQHRPDEVDLARARLPVALGHRPDRAVVLDDAVHTRPDLLGARQVAVLVEDARELARRLPRACASRRAELAWPRCGAPAAWRTTSRAARGRYRRRSRGARWSARRTPWGTWRRPPRSRSRRAPAGPAGPARSAVSAESTSPSLGQRAQVLARAADRHAELLRDLLGRRLAPPAHRVEHRPPPRRERGCRFDAALGVARRVHVRSRSRRMRWLSPNSCQRYPRSSAVRYAVASTSTAANASSIIRCDDSGSCQPVSRPSTEATPRSPVTTTSVQPWPGCATPWSSVTVASARTTVVPAATTRPP